MYTLLDDAKNLIIAAARWRLRRRAAVPTAPTPTAVGAHGSSSTASAHTSAFTEHRPIQGGAAHE
jgi:hypothetical protein